MGVKETVAVNRIGVGARFGALLLDGIVIFIAGIVVGGVIGGWLGGAVGAQAGAQGAAASGSSAEAGAAGGGLIGMFLGAIVMAPVGVAVLGLVWILWEGLTGAALGKLALGIRIRNADGTPASPGKLLARAGVKFSYTLIKLVAVVLVIVNISMISFSDTLDTVAKVCGLIVFIGCFLALGSGKQALHDMLVGTAVYPAKSSTTV
jgi:uncharacterized RDD family membrane protein YckC